jgi:DNA repair exonuclease SbcCD ATPase subunit
MTAQDFKSAEIIVSKLEKLKAQLREIREAETTGISAVRMVFISEAGGKEGAVREENASIITALQKQAKEKLQADILALESALAVLGKDPADTAKIASLTTAITALQDTAAADKVLITELKAEIEKLKQQIPAPEKPVK